MSTYDTLRLDSLLSEIARVSMHRARVMEEIQEAFDKGEQRPEPPKDLGDCAYPKTGMEAIDMLLKKYIDLYLNWQYHLLDIEIKKDVLLHSRNSNFDETDILCLVLVQEMVYLMMTGDCYQIQNIIELYASESTFENLKGQLEKYHRQTIEPPELIDEIEGHGKLYKTAEYGTIKIDASMDL